MRKAKRTFINTPKANRMVGGFDFSHMGFALLHEEKIIYALECTDEAIRNGNEILLNKAVELADMYPDYTCGVLHVMFAAIVKMEATLGKKKMIAMFALIVDIELLLKNLRLPVKLPLFRSLPSDNECQNND